ncbi:Transposase [Bacteroidales bacterium Barb6XT]|nr:Transposase [Bacteroidales bacterium Barb6XT]
MDCPKYGSDHKSKDGAVSGRQRYLCKQCGYHYTAVQKSDVKPAEVRRMALEMYLEGLGFRAIGRLLKISYGTVYRKIKDYGSKESLPQNTSAVEAVESDEMHTYVGSKKTIVGYGLLLTDLEKGLSLLSAETGLQKQGEGFGITLKR